MFVGELVGVGQIDSKYVPRWLKGAIGFVSSVGALLIIVPTGFLVLWSFWGTEFPGLLRPIGQPTLAWIQEILGTSAWRIALGYSFLLAAVVASLGSGMVFLHSYLGRFISRRLDDASFFVIMTVLLNPLLAYAMSLRQLAHGLGMSEWLTLGLGHLIVVLPLQYLVFEAARESVSTEMLWSARLLGASHGRALASVYFPNAKLPLVASWVVGFLVSFDEIVIALAVIESAHETVPLKLWHGIDQVNTPQPAAVAVILMLCFACGALVVLGARPRARVAPTKLPEVLRGLWRELVAATIVVVLVHLLFRRHSIVVAWLVEIGAGLLAWGIVAGVRSRKVILRALEVRRAEKMGLEGIPTEFFESGVARQAMLSDLLRAGGHAQMHMGEVQELARLSFEKCEAWYAGTDSHSPREFVRMYPDYLSLEMRRRGNADEDIRFLLLAEDALLEEHATEPGIVSEFVRSHQENGITLLRVDWEDARALADKHGMFTTDIGLFGKRYAVLFGAPAAPEKMWDVRLVSRGGGDAGWRGILRYLTDLVDRANEVRLEDGLLRFRGLDRAERESYKDRIRGAE